MVQLEVPKRIANGAGRGTAPRRVSAASVALKTAAMAMVSLAALASCRERPPRMSCDPMVGLHCPDLYACVARTCFADCGPRSPACGNGETCFRRDVGGRCFEDVRGSSYLCMNKSEVSAIAREWGGQWQMFEQGSWVPVELRPDGASSFDPPHTFLGLGGGRECGRCPTDEVCFRNMSAQGIRFDCYRPCLWDADCRSGQTCACQISDERPGAPPMAACVPRTVPR
jgi:hypothetical protein